MRLLLIIILIICSCSPKVDSVKKDDPQNQLTKTFLTSQAVLGYQIKVEIIGKQI